MIRTAVIGGGPGGLLAAYLLERKYGRRCDTSLFEAAGRVGGKVMTCRFSTVPVIYEAGVAECYDYSMFGPDPLHRLIRELGLRTIQTQGGTVVLDGRVLRDEGEIRAKLGQATLEAIEDFRRRASEVMPLATWCAGTWEDDNRHPWARLTCEEILERVVDPVARKYLKIAVHSDLATEPHLTNGLNGLKNFVMDLPGYIQQYSIVGGMEMLPRRLRESLSETRVVLGAAVRRVEETRSGTYRITFLRGSRIVREDFDAVFIALPHYHLHSVEWVGENLRRAMARHIAYYDRPAHYLRISMLFRRPFWRKILTGSWFMLDAFGGCCVYDEGTRHEIGGYGVLSWLLAGTDALSHANLDDTSLIDLALGSLPEGLAGESRESLIEAKVHRWLASVNALPGGFPVRDPKSAHQPDARNCPGVFIVGDYLLDSTLNGVTDSANIATDLLGSERDMCRLERPGESRTPAVARSSEGEFQGAALAC